MIEKLFALNGLEEWLIAGAIASVVFLAIWIAKKVLLRRIAAFAIERLGEPARLLRDLADATKMWLAVLIAVFAGAQALELPPRLSTLLYNVAVIAFLLQIAFWGNRAIVFTLTRRIKSRITEDAASATTLAVLSFTARLVLWSVIVLMALGNLGFNITGLVAGLGIGGIAVALAAQNILGDLFASLSIALDKPFLIGDFIIVGDKLGTVEYIGLKTTRVRSLGGEQIVFSNTDLLNGPIHNYKRMHERRVLFTFGVTYETPAEKLAAIPKMVREIIEAQSRTRFDRAHFKEYGDFALVHEVVYYVLDADYNVYMDVQHAINLEIMRRFRAERIDFAYPTQLHYVRTVTS